MTEYTCVDRTTSEDLVLVTLREVIMAFIAMGILVGTTVLVFFLERFIGKIVCPIRRIIPK